MGSSLQSAQLVAIAACGLLAALSVFLYVLFAYVALAKADMVAPLVNQGFTDVFSWVLTAYFAAGIVLTESPAANRNASS